MTDRLTHLMSEEADRIDVPRAPADVVLSRGHQLRRRRRAGLVVAGLAALAVVGTGAATLTPSLDERDTVLEPAAVAPEQAGADASGAVFSIGTTLYLDDGATTTSIDDASVKSIYYTSAGILEVYDLRDDCRAPTLLSRTPEAILGHESGWTRDGKTFYAASSGGQTFVAIDLTDPTAPRRLFQQRGVNYHGMRLSPDGRILYAAHIGNDLSQGTLPGEGLRILDVSEIQDRKPNPQVSVLSDLTWSEGSIPQVAQPFTKKGRQYLLEVDEFSRYGLNGGSPDPSVAQVGAGRIINVDDPLHPRVVSHLRLEVQQPAQRIAAKNDPGASSPVGGYTAHYCSAPRRKNPRLVACSMIGSGLRVFDIRNLRKPVEVAYFNVPAADGADGGASAMAQPAWDVKRRSIWYADGNSGFYVVRLTHGVGRLLRR